MLHQRIPSASVSLRNGRKVSLRVRATAETAQTTATRIVVKDTGSCTVKGTVRKVNEDRFNAQTENDPDWTTGEALTYAGVYDGHGGSAVAEWLETNLLDVISNNWEAERAPYAITDAFLEADKQLLKSSGFMGLGERGVGGSKCGATAASALVYVDPNNSQQTKLLTANVGDARTVLIRGGKPIQLSVDHVPDSKEERDRIERFNPNPKLPLVRYQGGTWRVGGLLALSRAFGDAYLKGSLQFEGLPEGSDGYSSGFGLIAEPYTTNQALTPEDTWLIIATDGLYAEVERGGGGGLDNDTLADLLKGCEEVPCDIIAETLATAAVEMGSTDDITVIVMRLDKA